MDCIISDGVAALLTAATVITSIAAGIAAYNLTTMIPVNANGLEGMHRRVVRDSAGVGVGILAFTASIAVVGSALRGIYC